jgi:hypothetical protein
MSWYYNFSMKTDHIPILSYVFIGVTSLVLTYATIADTTDEIILQPPTLNEPESGVAPESQSSMPAIALPSLSDTIEKLKSLNPFSTSATVSGQEEIPVAVPIPAQVEPSAPPLPMNKYPSSGGKKSIKNRKRKQKKTRRSSK